MIKYITASDAAESLGFTSTHIRRLINAGIIKAEKVGNQWLMEPKALSKIERKRSKSNGISKRHK